MNEWIFFFHIFVVIASALFCLRLGRTALAAFMALQGILANLFVVKEIFLFGFSVTCSDVFAVGGTLSLNLLQEYFGKESAQKALKNSFVLLLFFLAMSQIHLFYAPSTADQTHGAFQSIFSSTPRIIFASLATFYFVQQIDVRLFAKLKGPLPLRMFSSLFISQFLDTALFTFLGLYGLVEAPLQVLFFSFSIKCLVIAAATPLTALAKRMVRHVPL